jgi:hypothetical protein
MANLGERLVQKVQSFQNATGEIGMRVIIERAQQQMSVHLIEFDPLCGLLVDGRPPSVQWYQEAEDFHLLQWAPVILH